MSKTKHTKADYEGFERDLALMSRATLEWVYDQIYDPADSGLKRAICAVFWDRYADPLSKWPTYNTPVDDEPAWVQKLGKDHLVSHCPKGAGCRDSGHQPARKNPINGDIECSCGCRSSDLITGQRHPTAAVWPVETIDGIPHFVICSKADFADDPAHAPVNGGAKFWSPPRCICRWPLDQERLAELGLSLRKIPAH